jgi:hypothetical protein
MNTAIVQTLGADGSIVLPADVLQRWGTDLVVAIDTPDGLIIRPFEPDAVRRMRGKYTRRSVMAPGEAWRLMRDEDAEHEARRLPLTVPWGDGAAE